MFDFIHFAVDRSGLPLTLVYCIIIHAHYQCWCLHVLLFTVIPQGSYNFIYSLCVCSYFMDCECHVVCNPNVMNRSTSCCMISLYVLYTNCLSLVNLLLLLLLLLLLFLFVFHLILFLLILLTTTSSFSLYFFSFFHSSSFSSSFSTRTRETGSYAHPCRRIEEQERGQEGR